MVEHASLKEAVEIPDQQADRVLRSFEQNQGQLSHAFGKEMSILAKDGVWSEIVAIVSRAYQKDDAVERL